MRAVSADTSVPDAAADALGAGADWLLVCHDLEQAWLARERIRTALERGELDAGAAAASAARIARLRRRRQPTPRMAHPVAAHRALA